MMKEVIIDTQTQEVTERDLTKTEIDLLEANKIVEAYVNDKIEAEKAAKDALLAKLGITADEAKLLLS